MKKRFYSILLATMMLTSALVGCGKKEEVVQQDNSMPLDEIKEFNQNDYRGAFLRTEQIRDSVSNIVLDFNENNSSIISNDISNYWNSENYQYFSTQMLDNSLYACTYAYNETETSFDDVIAYTQKYFSTTNSKGENVLTVKNFNTTRVGENNYTLTYKRDEIPSWGNGGSYSLTRNYEILYDANHDWAKCITTGTTGNKTYYDGLYEYGRQGENCFVIQTQTERLYVIYEDGLYDYPTITFDNNGNVTSLEYASVSYNYIAPKVDSDGNVIEDAEITANNERFNAELEKLNGYNMKQDANGTWYYTPLADKNVVAFYYSKLDGSPLPYYEEIQKQDYATTYIRNNKNNDDEVDYRDFVPETIYKGELTYLYNSDNDSIFNHIGLIDKDWVTEMYGHLEQYIAYEDGNLTIKSYNRLSDQMEVFIYNADGTNLCYVEDKNIDMSVTKTEYMAQLSDKASASSENFATLENVETKDIVTTDEDGNPILDEDGNETYIADYYTNETRINDEFADNSFSIGGVIYSYQPNEFTMFTADGKNSLADVLSTEGYDVYSETEVNSNGSPIGTIFEIRMYEDTRDNRSYANWFYVSTTSYVDSYNGTKTEYLLNTNSEDMKILMNGIKVGYSTKSEVEAIYGLPTNITDNTNEYLTIDGVDYVVYRNANEKLYVEYKGDVVVGLKLYIFNSAQDTSMLKDLVIVEEAEDETVEE